MTEVNCESGLELKDGECYLNRDGEVVGPLEQSSIPGFPFKVCRPDSSDGFECYKKNGRWGLRNDDPRDLVSYLPRFDARHPEFQRDMDQITEELLGEEPEDEQVGDPKFTSCCIDSDGNLRLTLLVGANAIAFKFAPPVRYVP